MNDDSSDEELTIVSRSFKHPNALLDRRSCISFVIWRIDRWQDSDVDAKGFIGQLARLPNRLTQSIWVWLGEGGENSETPRV